MTLTELFTQIADAIRTQKGTSDTITPTAFPSEILSIVAGGETISGIQEVTEMPTASVETTGIIYRFIGQTNEDFENGKYYMTLLKNNIYSWILVNEEDIPATDKSMLIAYVISSGGAEFENVAVTITNTATGESIEATTDNHGRISQEVDAGTYTISVPEMSGYYTPEVITINVAANAVDYSYIVYVQSVSAVFGENDPATIAQVSEVIAVNNMTSEQVYSTYGWNVGDTHDITLTSGETIQVRILGFNHDDKSDGSGKAGITLQMVECLATRYPMNSTNTNAGGYAASKMKTETLPTLKALLPQEWQDVIKLVDKKSANGGSSNYSETLTLSEDLFLFAEIEIFGTTSYAQDGANEGSVYEYWNGKAAADRIKKYDTDADGVADTATHWWLRSARSTYTSGFCNVYTNGNIYNGSAINSRGVAFGFCI